MTTACRIWRFATYALPPQSEKGTLLQSLDIGARSHPTAVGGEEIADAAGEPPRAAPVCAPPPAPSQTELALRDIVAGARARQLWGLLGWQDIRRRYRRSRLGPFWLTISLGVLVATLGTLYGTLLKVEIAQYVPFLALGFIVWAMITGIVNDSCAAFTSAKNIIRQVEMPLSVHVYRVVWRNLIILFHNALVVVVVSVVFAVWPGWTGLIAVAGLALLCLNGVWVGLLLGLVSSRFRDVPPIVASIMRIAFFLTPIIWMPSLLPRKAALLDYNPFFHFLELVRAPLLGQAPALASWLVVLGILIGGWLVTLALFRRYRWSVAYWV